MSLKRINPIRIILLLSAGCGLSIFAFQQYRVYLTKTQFEETSKREETRKQEFLSRFLDNESQKKGVVEKASLLTQATAIDLKKYLDLEPNDAVETLLTGLVLDCLNGSSLVGAEAQGILTQKKALLSSVIKANALMRALQFMLSQHSTDARGAILFWERLAPSQSCLGQHGIKDIKEWNYSDVLKYSVNKMELSPSTAKRLGGLLMSRASVDQFWSNLYKVYQETRFEMKSDLKPRQSK